MMAGEASAYAGIVVFILAFVGAAATTRGEVLRPWRVLVPLSIALATMPGWWPDGFLLLMQLPGLGWFRAPARYTLISSLGMALLAGRGLDRRIDSQRFWRGFAIAIILGALAWGWSIYWTTGSDFRTSLMSKSIVTRFAAAGVVWFLAVVTIIAWRQKWLGAWAPHLTVAAVVELAVLVFVGPVVWVWNDKPLEDGPVLKKLAKIEGVGLVGGRLQDLPVSAGNTTAFPYLGITAPPPNYMLESVGNPPPGNDPVEKPALRRFGGDAWSLGCAPTRSSERGCSSESTTRCSIGSWPHYRLPGGAAWGRGAWCKFWVPFLGPGRPGKFAKRS